MITLFGAPGSGKSEQGKLLARAHGWQWLSYRDLLMAMHDKDVTFALNHGMYIDDKTMNRMMQNALSRASANAILDGFPTDLRQVRWLIDNDKIQGIKGAIILRVPHGELWRRLMARKRVDDTRAAIERRQEAYDRAITGMMRALMQDVRERIDEVLGEWGLIRRKQFKKYSERDITVAVNRKTQIEGDGNQTASLLANVLKELAELSLDE